MNAVGTLENAQVRLEPLSLAHVASLATAAAEDPDLYALAPVPTDRVGMRTYVDAALADAAAGRAVPFAIVRKHVPSGGGAGIDQVVGSTRFMNLEWWAWPPRPIRVSGEPRRAACHPPWPPRCWC